MRILYIIDQTNLFGSELHVLDLVRKFGPANKLRLLAFKDGPLLESIRDLNLGVEISIVSVSWASGFFRSRAILKEIRDFAPDIIHSHQPKAIFFGSIMSKIAGKKHVSTIHSIPNGFALVYTGIRRKVVFMFHTMVQYFAEAFSTKSIFITNYNKEKYSRFKNKSVVIYNWVSDRLTTKKSDQNITNPFTEEGATRLFSVGSIDSNKGFKELLMMFNNLKGELNYELIIAGSGNKETEDDLKNYIAANNMHPRVKLAGYQSNLEPFYSNADYFILLPKEEAFGLVYVEAMRFGLPVICSDIPQLREIVPAENIFLKNGSYFDREVLEKLTDKEYRENMGAINKQSTQTLFNIDEQVAKVYALYTSLAANN